MSGSGGSSAPRIKVFRPTLEEFKDFTAYIEYVESTDAHKAGLAKIIPPDGWIPRKHGYDNIEMIIPAPISQVVTGRQGLYQQINIQQKSMTVKDFKKLAESTKYMTPAHFDYEDLERKYWKNITYNSPIYGADVSGSLYDEGVDEFNIQHLNTILDMVKEDYEIQIEGVNTAYLYYGMWKTTFAWHTEDMDLYSINYLHFGAPKTWYVVPPEHGRRLERLAAGFFHGSHQSCAAFLRHKMTIVSPHILKQYSIPYSKITQEPGEFMITFPFAYHSGFNHGYNCAESTNFALPRWIEYGKRTTNCTCRNDCVKICMDMFVKKFQPDIYELWKAGKDYGTHPEDPSKHYAAPPPKKLDLALSAQREERRKAREMQATQRIKRHPISKVDKKDTQFSKTPRESDEDTESYDASEVITPRNSRKQTKKSSTKAESCVKAEPKEEKEKVQEVVNESSECDQKSEVKDENDDEEQKETREMSEEKECIDTNKSANLDLIGTKVETDNPPKLKPFWDSPEKFPVEDVKTSVSEGDQTYGLLNKYPHLRDAISSGAFSMVPISGKPDAEGCSTSNFTTGEPSTGLNQTWRCEQTNNGLKMKFVQPKKINQNAESLSGPMSQTQKDVPNVDTKNEENPPKLLDSSINETPEKRKSSQRKRRKYVRKAAGTRSPGSGSDSSPNSLKVQRADSSLDSWAHPLKEVWQHQPHNFQAEIEFNEKLSSITPHCAICVIFTPMYNSNTFPTEPSYVPSFSPVRMPAFCYGNSLNSECIMDTSSLLRSDGTAPLLVCSVCKVCVHATCYGVSMLPIGMWTCTRCSKQAEEAQCCLCVIRGGALKPTTDSRWAHVVCAILVTETYFESTVQKQPINVSKITPTRQRLKCKYCVKTSLGTCVQCQSGKCYLPYHVTCGFMAGVIFETSDWPEPINMICTRHTAKRRKPPKRELTNVSVGERVIAKHKTNRRYYWANVKNKYIQEYYSILFEDNSHSTNTLPEDIVSRNVAIHGPPQMNEKVQVKWTDDKIYNGLFKGSQSAELYVIEFDDGSVLHMERKQIYAADEELPKEIQTKLSHSSDGGNYDFFSDPPGKRVRLSKQKYS